MRNVDTLKLSRDYLGVVRDLWDRFCDGERA